MKQTLLNRLTWPAYQHRVQRDASVVFLPLG